MIVVLGDQVTKSIRVESYILHPQYMVDGSKDIAMIKLAEEVDLNVFTPVCLANIGDDFTGRNAWAYGEQ